ncbi:MAG TPA: uroporphyrinogen-III synthase [Acetobacteraceae bacterium]|nr:uroporphyrinogen-III synthase [Acetobacteraceae bacterium]
MPDTVLVTRPEPGASETAARLRALGRVPLLAPMLTIRPHPLVPTGRPQAVLVTSGNALPALPSTLRTLPLLAVGDATAARARASGFATVRSAGRDATALAALAGQVCRPADGALLLASGAGQGAPLAAALRAQGFRVQRRVAYAAAPAEAIPDDAAAALRAGEVAAALFFSAETARVFVTRLPALLPVAVAGKVIAIALSPVVARALGPLPWRAIRVASHPNQDELLNLLP